MLHIHIISIYMLCVYFSRTTSVPQIPMCVKRGPFKNECIQKMGYVPAQSSLARWVDKLSLTLSLRFAITPLTFLLLLTLQEEIPGPPKGVASDDHKIMLSASLLYIFLFSSSPFRPY